MYFEKSTIGNNKLWTYIVSIILVFLFSQLLGALPLGIVVSAVRTAGNIASTTGALDPVALGIDLNVFLFLMIIPFAMGLLGLWVCLGSIHKKKLLDIITGRNKFDWKRFFFAALIWGIIFLVATFASYLNDPTSYEFQFQPIKFIILLFVVVLFLPFQTSFEELIFRGYIMQGISLIFKNKWIPLLITSILFGLMHITNPEIKEFGIAIMLPQYILLGLFLGILVVMDDGLELALGVHAINNIFSALFITHKSSVLQTPALFKTNTIDPKFELIVLCFSIVLFIIVISRKYKWKSWKTVFNKINYSPVIE